MGRPLRFLPQPNTSFEVTIRCVQGRLLLRPCGELNDLVLGVLGRALSLYPAVKLHLVTVASNHMHLLVTVPETEALSRFMCFVNSNIAREVGRLHRWGEKFWGRRFRAIAVLDDRALLERARYILSHGCKEDLVGRPADWPGIQCADALSRGAKLRGTWYDRTKEYRSRRARKKTSGESFSTSYEVALAPLPCWEGLGEAERRRRASELIAEIERDERRRRGRGGMLGRRRVLQQDPHSVPTEAKRGRAPSCHSSEPELRKSFVQSYRAFLDAFRRAARKLRQKRKLVPFPEHCFPPSVGYWSPAAAAAG